MIDDEAKEMQMGNLPPYYEMLLRLLGYDPSTTRIQTFLIFECASNVFRALLEEVGTAEAIETIKPFGIAYGQGLATITKDWVGIEQFDAESLARSYGAALYAASSGNMNPIEIRDGKAIVECFDCPTRLVGSPNEMCAMSHFNSEGLCQAANPEYEFIWTHHLNNGDDRCRFIVKKKSEKLVSGGSEVKTSPFIAGCKPIDLDIDRLGVLEKTIPISIPQFHQDLIIMGIASSYFGFFSMASVDRIGSQRTIELGEPLARKTGSKIVSQLTSGSMGVGDLDAVKDKLVRLQKILNQTGEPATVTGSGIEGEIVDCPFKAALPEQCKHLEGVFKGLVEAIDPDYEFSYDKMMSKGDPVCHWVVKKKGESTIMQPVAVEEGKAVEGPQMGGEESALELLKKRFVRGEISKEEYLEKKYLLDV